LAEGLRQTSPSPLGKTLDFAATSLPPEQVLSTLSISGLTVRSSYTTFSVTNRVNPRARRNTWTLGVESWPETD
jgi:hypothetical protein